ncbi:amidohydrolase/deacetylase family metallohydrolase [Cupriavidus sp. DB3]|uniref:amidohydrolase/deacetylase family metallohydrolase n=1 Tax=Cupriavidus sp. DB3 TaxID=2873259 RepID=UPI001CF202C8|nr:amidohydrolase/deacetylase family metallohydrolase [Cupriavidus sp. DB3]MCA7083721.1 amidohydrolase/deacetylase family metallohydrolase [Cupriavidus sp. DB3]
MTESNRDIVLRQGRVIDPDAGIDAVCDVWIRNGRIAAVGDGSAALPADADAAEVVDCRGKLVLPGLIDTHAHVYQYVTGRFGLNADMCGVHSGVTTLIDQGGASCMTLPGFRHYVAEPASSRIYAFLSAYLVGGLEGHYYAELYRPECVDVDATVKAALANADLVRGIKAHAELGGFARWGVEVMRASAEIGRQTALPVYVHFGQLWPMPGHVEHDVDPDTILEQVVDMLKPGDVLAHPFSRHPGGFVNRDGTVHPLAREAAARGLKIDVGHGSHFSYRMARTVLEAGIVPDTLGADMHGYNTHVPAPAGTPAEHPDQDHMFLGRVRFSLVSAMTSMLALGLPLDHVVRMATVNAASMAGLKDGAGTLRVGAEANVSVLEDLRGRWVLADNEGTQVVGERMLEPVFCLRAGQRFDAAAPILPVAQVA